MAGALGFEKLMTQHAQPQADRCVPELTLPR